MQDKYQHTAIEQAARDHWAQPLWNGHEAYRVTEDASKPAFTE
jgi:leucyl-tRNA synthetase